MTNSTIYSLPDAALPLDPAALVEVDLPGSTRTSAKVVLAVALSAAATGALGAMGCYAKDPSTTTGLTWGYGGGLFLGNTVAAGTVALTDNATNYVVVLRSTGAVSVSTTSTNSLSALYAKLYKVTALGGIVTAIVDQRLDSNGLLISAGAGPIAPDTDGTLAANSDAVISSQKAVKTYVDNSVAALEVPVDTDGTLAGDSDTHVPSQKAVKTYVDAHLAPPIVVDTDGALAANSDSVVPSQKAIKSYVDNQTLAKSTDGTLAADSDAYVPSQKAVKTYVDNALIGGALDTDPTLAADSDARAASQKATKTYVDGKVAGITGGLSYLGAWNANSNTPALASGVGTGGGYYKVSVAGTTNLDGHAVWYVGDKAVFNGTAWDKFDGVDGEVLSVAGRVGAVVLSNTDIAGLGTASTLAADTDGTLAANSDARLATQKAVKAYVDAHASAPGSNTAAYNNATSFRAFGDSYTTGDGASVSANAYINVLAAARGWTLTNLAVSGSMSGDVALAAFPIAVAVGDQSTLQIGTNDARVYIDNAALQGVFKRCHLSLAAWLAIPDARKVKGQAATLSGTWSNYANYGGALGVQSSTVGSTASFATFGTVAYVCGLVTDGDTSTYSIAVDGVSVGTYQCAPLGGPSVTTGHSTGYIPQLIRIPGLSEGPHTVVVTVVSVGGAGVVLLWGAGNQGHNDPAGPNVWVGNVPRLNATGYAAPAGSDAIFTKYTQVIRANCAALARDGLNVAYVDGAARLNPAANIAPDGIHPNDSGHAILAKGYLEAMNQIGKPSGRAPGGYPSVEPVSYQTATSYTLALSDDGGELVSSNAATQLVVLPADGGVPFDLLASGRITAGGAGTVSIVAGAGVEIDALSGYTAISGQYGTAKWKKTGANRYSLSGPLSAAPLPPDPLAGIAFATRIEAWRETAYGDGAAVPTATDFSGNANHLTQATTSKQPVFKTGIVDGQAVYRFNGTTQVLVGPAIAAMTNTQARWYYVVYSCGSPASAPQAIFAGINSGASGSGGADTFYINPPANGSHFVWRYSQSGTDYVDIVDAPAAGTSFRASALILDGTTAHAYFGGGDNAAPGQIGTAPAGTFNLAIGSILASGTALELVGDIAAIFCGAGTLTTPQQSAIANYISTKWGVSL